MFILIVLIYGGCKPNIFGCVESIYHFELDAQVVPDKDTVHIGDTIWVEINSPDVFLDQTTNKQINFSGANNLGTAMGFVKLVNVSPIRLADAVDDFDFVLISGTVMATPNAKLLKEYLIPDINGRYVFKLGIIPKDTGTFRFNLGNPVGVYRNGKGCPKADFYMRLTQTNQHYYLYPGDNNVTPAGADYYFYVK